MTKPPEPPAPRGRPASPAEREASLESAVLRLLLVEHPAQLTVGELVRELCECGADEPGAVEAAMRRLIGVGLAHRHGPFVIASRVALYFDRLALD